MGCRNVTHADVPITDWALVSLGWTRPTIVTDTCLLFNRFSAYIERAEAQGEKHQTHWRVLVLSRADYGFGRLRPHWRVDSVAIAHRSVILECFACVRLVLTIIVHRLVWPWYRCCDQMSTQRLLPRPHHELECGTGVSRSPVENYITT